ncbi:MAG TPA: pre-peptidase C-terminal domain-containing protein [Polyangiaceae bacterium]|nr:pre-peptidase C-terminal domain-containing protein [Polyangiaceae bacterium]
MNKRIVNGAGLMLLLFTACSAPVETTDEQAVNREQALAPTVMRVVGKQLLDSSGQPFLARGIEGWFGPNAQANMPTLVDAIASQGFNAVRLQLLTNDLSKIEPLIKRFQAKGMVVYLVDANMPNPDGVDWFGLCATRAMVERNKYNLVVDATIEEEGEGDSEADMVAWLADQKRVITKFRGWGYTQPLTIGTPNAGRYLRALLDHGQELIDHDPLHSLVLNAQMYWGAYSSGWSYQELNGFSAGNAGITQATAAVAAKPFLIQFGLDAKDSGGSWANVPYSLLMTEAQSKKIGTMWWQWKDPGDNDPNSLVTDQLVASSLTPLGNIVINTHAASIKKTSKLVAPIAPGTGSSSCFSFNESGTVAANAEKRYQTPTLPAGAHTFTISGTGDADLYVRRGSAPTTTTYDCRPYLETSNETCTVTLTSPAVIHVMVRGYAASSTFTLTGG